MPNFLEMLRLANIFNPSQMGNDLPSQGGISGNMGGQGNIFTQIGDIFKPKPKMTDTNLTTPVSRDLPPGIDEIVDVQGTGQSMSPMSQVGQRMRELYQPSTEASDRFDEMITNYPKYEDYKPGWLRRIGAMVSAFGPGGQQAGMEFLNRPYNQKLSDWKNVIGPTQQAANLERQENVNERTLAYQTMANELRAEAEANRVAKNERDAAIRQQRADVYEFKAKNPNLKFDFSGPTVLVADPKTGEVKNTNIPTGSLSDADKMSLGQEHALERIGAGGEQQRQTEILRQYGRENTAETRGWELGIDQETGKSILYNKITGETKPVNKDVRPASRTTTTRGELPTQTKVRQFNAAKQLANTNPELGAFIKFGPGTNEFTIQQPSSGFFGSSGPTPEQIQQIQSAIYGTEIPISQPGRTGSPTSNNTTPTTPTASNAAPKGDAKRNQAIELLRKNNKPVTEKNIQFVMGQIK